MASDIFRNIVEQKITIWTETGSRELDAYKEKGVWNYCGTKIG